MSTSLYAPYVTADLEEHRKSVREWAERVLAPLRDKFEEANIDGVGKEHPIEIFRKMGRERLLAAHVPEQYGGPGKGFVAEIITIEEIARVTPAFSTLVDYTPTLVCNPILMFGTEEQKTKYLPPLASGEKLGSYALTEPNWGSDVASIETKAEKRSGEYVIDGHKKFITVGNLADVLLVYAKTKPEAGARGITAFIVESKTSGISYPKLERKMGLKAIPVSEIKLEGVRVPAENILGGPAQENRGIYVALDALNHGRCGVAAQGVGAGQAALEQATRFASERMQSSAPIINYGAIQCMIADIATKLDAARLMTYRASHLRDLYIRGQIKDGRIINAPAAMAKCYATEAATFAAHRAIQIFGGRGFMSDPEYAPIKELPTPEQLYRDCRIFEIYEGTNEIQRYVIARETAALYGKKA